MSKSANNPGKYFGDIAKKTLLDMWGYAKNGLYCDVVLIAAEDRKKIPAHRAVLCARNEFFRNKFEKFPNKNVIVSDISGHILEMLVKYCYTGTVDIAEDNVQLLLSRAAAMSFSEIVEECQVFQMASIDVTNCLNVLTFAKFHNCQDLLKSATEYMKLNFTNVAATDAFLKLTEEELQEYLSLEGLEVESEKNKFVAIMRWIDHESKARSCALSNLLPLIQWHQMEKNYLLEFALNSARKEYHLTLADAIKENLSNAQIMPEKLEENASRIVAVCEKQIQVYNILKNVVGFKFSIPSDCQNSFEPTLFGEKVILVCASGKVKCFDLKANAWHDLASTLTGRWQCSVATLNDCVYAVGGLEDNGQTLNTVERWDSNSKQWNSVASMNHGRKNHCTAILNGKLYAIGEFRNNNMRFNSVECYDPIANKWSVRSPMLTARSGARAVVANKEIFVFGGDTGIFQSSNSIEKYNADTNTWKEVGTMCCRRSSMGAYLFNNKIYLLGGFNWESTEWLKSVEEFDPATNKSKLIDHLNIENGGNMHCFPYLSVNK